MEHDEIQQLYRTQLQPGFAAFLARTRDRLAQLGRLGAILAPAGIVASYVLYQQFPEQNFVFLPGGLVFGYLLVRYFQLRQGYRHRFKREVIAPIVETIDACLHFEPEGSIAREHFEASSLFDAQVDSFEGEDLVTGRVGEADIRFSEIEAKRRVRDVQGRRPWQTIFKGFFIVADFPRAFRATTLVLPDTTEPLLGHIAHTLQAVGSPRGELVRIEDREFERLFAIYSDDEGEARRILSPSLVASIVRFRKRTGQTLCLSFDGSRLYVAIPSQRDRFEPPELVSIQDMEKIPRVERMLLDHLQAYMDDLRLGLGLVRELSGNERLWG
jgi:Protein of unknown function (DUF3137)